MGERDQGEARYRAFLSYSHKDIVPAGRLHRRLEAYRIPRRLVGRETARGPVPARLWPIFRDREELPAATDLSRTVRDALARSDSLIVLCSPAAAASLWVAEEIKVFRELHPDRPILAAILDGDPPDCFPELLRALGKDGTWHEPLATDLRRDRDGERLGLLKLVAGITGLGLDDLVQRDANRRVRRVMAVTVGAVLAMLGMAALAVIAVTARQEAERQQAEAERQRGAAEGQIEFMLTELRSRLRGVGRIDVMEAVNASALRYYAGQGELSALPEDSIQRRARVLLAIGEDHVANGNLDAALNVFRQAFRATEEQLARAPDDPARVYEHAGSEYWIGRIYELRRDWPRARLHFSRFATATQRLIQLAPNNPDYMLVVGGAAVNLGNVHLRGERNYVAAQHSYERAVHWFSRVLQARPRETSSHWDLANAHAYLADTFFMREMWRQSLDARLRQYRIVERLYRAEPANMETGFRLAVAERAVARSYEKVGDLANARSHMVAAYAWGQRLRRHDPRNADWLLFEALLGCDIYFGNVGFPPDTTRARISARIRAASAALTAQRNPRASEFSNCVNAVH